MVECGCVGGARGCGAERRSRFRQLFCSGNCFFGVRPTLCWDCSQERPEARGAPAGTDGARLNISTRVLFVKSLVGIAILRFPGLWPPPTTGRSTPTTWLSRHRATIGFRREWRRWARHRTGLVSRRSRPMSFMWSAYAATAHSSWRTRSPRALSSLTKDRGRYRWTHNGF